MHGRRNHDTTEYARQPTEDGVGNWPQPCGILADPRLCASDGYRHACQEDDRKRRERCVALGHLDLDEHLGRPATQRKRCINREQQAKAN